MTSHSQNILPIRDLWAIVVINEREREMGEGERVRKRRGKRDGERERARDREGERGRERARERG